MEQPDAQTFKGTNSIRISGVIIKQNIKSNRKSGHRLLDKKGGKYVEEIPIQAMPIKVTVIFFFIYR